MGQITNNFPTVAMTANGADANTWTYNGTKGAIQLEGTWDGATVVVQKRLLSTLTFITDANFSLTDDGVIYFSDITPSTQEYRFFLSGVGTTSITATLVQDQG